MFAQTVFRSLGTCLIHCSMLVSFVGDSSCKGSLPGPGSHAKELNRKTGHPLKFHLLPEAPPRGYGSLVDAS